MEGVVRAALRVDVRKLRQRTRLRVDVELFLRLDVRSRFSGRDGPLVEQGVGLKLSRVGVVDPADPFLRQLLEDGFLGQGGDVEGVVVAAVARGGAGCEVGAVGIRRARNGREPAVEKDIVLRHGGKDGDMFLAIIIDGLPSTADVLRLEHRTLLRHKAEHILVLELVLGRVSFVGMVGAEEFHVDAADAMCRVIPRDVCGGVLRANDRAVRVGYVDGIAVFDVEQAVDGVVVAEAAGEGVEGTVLENEDDDVLDTRFPALGLIAVFGHIVVGAAA